MCIGKEVFFCVIVLDVVEVIVNGSVYGVASWNCHHDSSLGSFDECPTWWILLLVKPRFFYENPNLMVWRVFMGCNFLSLSTARYCPHQILPTVCNIQHDVGNLHVHQF